MVFDGLISMVIIYEESGIQVVAHILLLAAFSLSNYVSKNM
jgi:hypothetical protein